MNTVFKLVLLLLIIMLSACENPKGELEKMGIQYSQENFFDKGVDKENQKVIKLFLDAGLDINASTKEGDTALHELAYAGNFELMKMIISDYAGDVNQVNTKGYDVLCAYLSENIKKYDQVVQVVPFLLENGATLERFSSIKRNALVKYTGIGDIDRSRTTRDLKLLKFMFDNGYNVNAQTASAGSVDNYSYLHAAALHGDIGLLELLLNYDVNINAKGPKGNTVFHSIYNRFPNWVGSCFGCDSKYWQNNREELNNKAVQAVALIEKMIAKGGNISQPNNSGDSALGSMKMGPSVKRDKWIGDLVKVAIENGDNINAIANNDRNASTLYRLFYELQNEDMDRIDSSVAFMLKNGADPLQKVSSSRRAKTPLDAFCRNTVGIGSMLHERKNHPEYPYICKVRNDELFKTYYLDPGKYRAERLKADEANKQASILEAKRKVASAKKQKQDKIKAERAATVTRGNLMWMRCSIGQQWTGSSCKGYSKSFKGRDVSSYSSNFGNLRGWRLPTADELNSMVYCSKGRRKIIRKSGGKIGRVVINGRRKPASGECLDRGYQRPTVKKSKEYPQFTSQTYWSSEPVRNKDKRWTVDFRTGVNEAFRDQNTADLLLVRDL